MILKNYGKSADLCITLLYYNGQENDIILEDNKHNLQAVRRNTKTGS